MSGFKQTFSQKQVQNLSLSVSMKLSLELLQMNTLQLKEYLEKEMLENPVVDIQMKGFTNNHDFDITDHRISISDVLLPQLDKPNLSLVEGIIANCDRNGYLKASASEIAKIANLDVVEVEAMLKQIRECEPYGIASMNLKQCLQVQVEKQYPSDPHLYEMLDYLEDIAKNYTDKICRSLNIDKQEYHRCIQVIQTLNPRPASIYSMENINFVKPDIILNRIDSEFVIQIPEYFNIHIHDMYKGYELSKSDKKQINESMQRARNLMDCLALRNETLKNIFEVMVNTQSSKICSITNSITN